MAFELNHLQQPVGNKLPSWSEPHWPNREPMRGRYCRLESLAAESHALSLFESNLLDESERNWTYLAYGPYSNFAEYREWVEAQSQSRDPIFFAIVDAASNAAVGVASYLRITPTSGSIEVGHLNFSPRLQRTPAATESMFLMMSRAFELGYRRYEWKCDALNAPSCRAAERLGFSFEGIFRHATIVKGRNRDTAWFSVIDSDWPALKAAFGQWLDSANFDERGEQRRRLSDLTAAIGTRQFLSG